MGGLIGAQDVREGMLGGDGELQSRFEVVLSALSAEGEHVGGDVRVVHADFMYGEDVPLGLGEQVADDFALAVGEDVGMLKALPFVGEVGGVADERTSDTGVVGGVHLLNGSDVARLHWPHAIVAAGGGGGLHGVEGDEVLGEGRRVTEAVIEIGNAEEHGEVVGVVAHVRERGLE